MTYQVCLIDYRSSSSVKKCNITRHCGIHALSLRESKRCKKNKITPLIQSSLSPEKRGWVQFRFFKCSLALLESQHRFGDNLLKILTGFICKTELQVLKMIKKEHLPPFWTFLRTFLTTKNQNSGFVKKEHRPLLPLHIFRDEA